MITNLRSDHPSISSDSIGLSKMNINLWQSIYEFTCPSSYERDPDGSYQPHRGWMVLLPGFVRRCTRGSFVELQAIRIKHLKENMERAVERKIQNSREASGGTAITDTHFLIAYLTKSKSKLE